MKKTDCTITREHLARADFNARTILDALRADLLRPYKELLFDAILYLINRDSYKPKKRRRPLPHELFPLEEWFYDDSIPASEVARDFKRRLRLSKQPFNFCGSGLRTAPR